MELTVLNKSLLRRAIINDIYMLEDLILEQSNQFTIDHINLQIENLISVSKKLGIELEVKKQEVKQ
jgi:hypothetical protein